MYISPTFTTKKGNYLVSIPESNGDFFVFQELDEALEFYAKRLDEYPCKIWKK